VLRRRLWLKSARALTTTKSHIDLVRFVLAESGEAIGMEFGTPADFAPGDVVKYGVQTYQVVAVRQPAAGENATVLVRPITRP
jgi:hypothetical protein